MTPQQRVVIERVAAELERHGMSHQSAALKWALREELPDDRPCPVLDDTGQVRAIPWGLAQILHPAYGHDQTLERMAERGGFGRRELGMLAVDQYSSSSRPRPGRLERMPLLTLYEAAVAPSREKP